MKGYTYQGVQTRLLETGLKPLFSTDCEPGITPVALDQQTPITSPIHVELGTKRPDLDKADSTPPPPSTWRDLVTRQVNLGDPSPSPRVMDNYQHQSSKKGGGELMTWDELVQQGAMLGEDGTDTLVMQKKQPLYH